MFFCLFVCLTVYLSAFVYVWLCVCIPVCLLVCPSVSVFVCVFLALCPDNFSPYNYVPTGMQIHPSAHPSIPSIHPPFSLCLSSIHVYPTVLISLPVTACKHSPALTNNYSIALRNLLPPRPSISTKFTLSKKSVPVLNIVHHASRYFNRLLYIH